MLPQTSVFLIFLLAFQIVYSDYQQCTNLIQGTNPNPTHAHRIAKRSIPAALNFNEETFAAQVVPNKPHFVMFFAPWCGWSRRLYPTWQNLAVKYNQNYENEQDVVIGKVDCTIESALCNSQDVRGYPTLKFFKYGPDSGVMNYDGERDLQSLASFIDAQMLGTSIYIYSYT